MSLSTSATSTAAISKLPPATSPAPVILACGCSHGPPLSPSPPAPLPSAKTAPGSPTAGTSPKTSAKSSVNMATSAPPTPTLPTGKYPPQATSPSRFSGAVNIMMRNCVYLITIIVIILQWMANFYKEMR